MVTYSLNNIRPNQKFTIVKSGHSIEVTFNTAYGMLFASTKIDGRTIQNSVRCVANSPLMPYKAYIPDGVGNLLFYCKDDEYPRVENFNDSCLLVYLTPSEIKELSEK